MRGAQAERLARKFRRQEGRRRRILEAAHHVLRRDGLERFTLAATADEADLSKAALFYYFDSKEQLMTDLLETLLEREWGQLARAVGEAESGIDALAALTRAHFEFHRHDLASFRALGMSSQLPGDGRTLLSHSIYPGSQRVNDALVRRLEEDPRLHPDADPRALANTAFLLAHGLLALLASLEPAGGRTRIPADELLAEASATLRRGALRPD